MKGMSRYSKVPYTAAYERVRAFNSLGGYEEHLRELLRAREELSRSKGRIENTVVGLLVREDKLKEELEDVQKKMVESKVNLKEVEGYISKCTKEELSKSSPNRHPGERGLFWTSGSS